MGLSPLLNAPHVLRTAEVIPVAGFVQPPPLAGGLAGPATIRGRTIKLAIRIMPVRRKENIAATALASSGNGTHRVPSGKKTPAPPQSKTARTKSQEQKKEEELARGKSEENQPEEKRIFKPPENHHFHSAADTAAQIVGKQNSGKKFSGRGPESSRLRSGFALPPSRTFGRNNNQNHAAGFQL